MLPWHVAQGMQYEQRRKDENLGFLGGSHSLPNSERLTYQEGDGWFPQQHIHLKPDCYPPPGAGSATEKASLLLLLPPPPPSLKVVPQLPLSPSYTHCANTQ
eukprot:Sspe_Gene.38571::Locus_18590_Transcript_1_1_Confidence_1.000_Length_2008::g.38571::m.38571